MSDDVLLTVCIPTYNRGARAHALALFVIGNILPLDGRIELLIANNCSTDSTATLMESLASDRVRVIHHDPFLPTAEENMFASLESCWGEYIWFLGDDDVPIIATVRDLLVSLEANTADLLIFNSRVIDGDGAPLASRMLQMNGPYLDVGHGDMIRVTGFVFLLAGISNIVLKKEFASGAAAQTALDIQAIYAHVVWLIECFSQRRVRIVNAPLVYYRHDREHEQQEHFRRYAEAHGMGDFYIWGIGLALQLEHLVERGCIKRASVPEIFESRRDGSRFRLLDDCVHKIFQQVTLSLHSDEARNVMTPAAFYRARDFLVTVDLLTYDLLLPIEMLLEIALGLRSKGEKDSWVGRFHAAFQGQQRDRFRCYRMESQHGYDLYRIASGWAAVSTVLVPDPTRLLAAIDPEDNAPYWYVAQTRQQIVEMVRNAREDPGYTAARSRAVEQERIAEFAERALEQYVLQTTIRRQITMPVRFIVRVFARAARSFVAGVRRSP